MAAVAMTGWFFLHGSREAVAELASRFEAGLAARIRTRLNGYLDETFRLTTSNAALPTKLRDMDALRNVFWHQLQAYDQASAIFAATEGREFAGVERRPDGSRVLTRANRATGFAFTTHTANLAGSPESPIHSQPDYDPRRRPWYRRALESDGTTWTDIYPFPLHKTLYLSAVQAFRDEHGAPQGVVATGISLDWVGNFLLDLAKDENVRIVVIERNGLLVASSTADTPYRDDSPPRRLRATESADPLIRDVAKATLNAIRDQERAFGPIRLELDFNGNRHLVGIRPFSDGRGIDWILVIAIPESSLLATARTAEAGALAGTAAVLLLAVLASILFARRLVRPVVELARATAAIAPDRLDLTVDGSGPREFASLAHSFNRMVFRLRESFDALKQVNRELEVRVAERTDELVAKNRDLAWEVAVRGASETALRHERDFTEALINSLPGMFYVIDTRGHFVKWNLNLERTSGLSAAEMARASPLDFFRDHDRERVANAIAEAFANGHSDVEADFVPRSGVAIPHHFNGHRTEQEGEPLLVGMGVDISRRREAETRIRHLARHDTLTGLPNRMLLRDRLDQALATARRTRGKVALLFVDLDGFKRVNDDHGHAAGDAVLRETARRVVACVRETDTVARYGGDEFIVVLTMIEDDENISRVANEILKTMNEPFRIAAATVYIGASIGAAIFPDHAIDGESLVQLADTTMYRAKEAGKGRLAIAADSIR